MGLVTLFYLLKFFVPLGLLPVYPHWEINLPALLAWPLLGGATFYFWLERRNWGRNALLGWGFFLINLGPLFIFFFWKNSTMTWSFDHLIYISLIGLIALLIMGLEQLRRPYRIGIFMSLLTAWAFLGHSYAKLFSDQKGLWTYTVEHNPKSWQAHYQLGVTLAKNREEISSAIFHLQEAIRLRPGAPSAALHNNLGILLAEAPHRLSEAIDEFQIALQIDPSFEPARQDLAIARAQQMRYLKAR